MTRLGLVLLIASAAISFIGAAKKPFHFTFKEIDTGTDASFRALRSCHDGSFWIGGSKGTILKWNANTETLTNVSPAGFGDFDFRSLWAFDSLNCLAVNAGSPLYVLRTGDGGKSWQKVFELSHEEAFADGISFWNRKEGLIYGDPIGGRMLILRTRDSGRTWEEAPDAERPQLAEGEASFAASGTGIKCFGKKRVIISTGGVVSRLWSSDDKGKTWRDIAVPVIQGEPSTGIFSFDFASTKRGVVVGGDYLKDTLRLNHVFYTPDGGKTWHRPERPTFGYRECVAFLPDGRAWAVGPTGLETSSDGGVNWYGLRSDRGLHVFATGAKGDLILLAGKGGKLLMARKVTGYRISGTPDF